MMLTDVMIDSDNTVIWFDRKNVRMCHKRNVKLSNFFVDNSCSNLEKRI